MYKVKYLFMNMAFRSKTNIEKFKTMKCIWDMQDSIMIIFCGSTFFESFEEQMIENFKFERASKDQVDID